MGDISLKGYHGTCSYAIKSIESRGLDPDATKYRSNHWLGQGVYFFEDVSQAMWWAENTSRRNRGSFPVVYSASIVVDEKHVLDLDDKVVLAGFIQFYKDNLKEVDKFCKEEDAGLVFEDREQFRAVFFDYYRAVFGIKVIVFTFSKDVVGYVPNFPVNCAERQWQKDFLRDLNLSFKEKQICVSDKDCIKDRKLMYNGEEAEVI